MKAMLIVVVFVALIATAEANVPIFSEGNLKSLMLTMPNTPLVTASLINPDVKRTLTRAKEVQTNTFSLFTDSIASDQEEIDGHPKCGKSLGIELGLDKNDMAVFCDLDLTRVILYKGPKNDHVMMMHLLFAHNGTKPFVLVIPIYRMARVVQLAEQSVLESWANTHHVGFLSPFALQQLTDIRLGKPIVLDFNWLQNLLTHKLSKSSLPITLSLPHDGIVEAAGYIARPLVLSDDVMKNIMELV